MGLSGVMAIHIEDDEHYYDFDYDSDPEMEGFLHNRHPNWDIVLFARP